MWPTNSLQGHGLTWLANGLQGHDLWRFVRPKMCPPPLRPRANGPKPRTSFSPGHTPTKRRRPYPLSASLWVCLRRFVMLRIRSDLPLIDCFYQFHRLQRVGEIRFWFLALEQAVDEVAAGIVGTEGAVGLLALGEDKGI